MKTHAKTSILLIFFLIFFSLITQHSSLNTLFAQVPKKFNYQAVVRDGNTLLVDKTLDVKFEILQGSPTGSLAWTETQTDVNTNSLGLLNLKVGETNNLDVDWNSGPYYLKVQLDLKDGNGFQDFGNTELLSVPYALNTQSVSSLEKLDIQGSLNMDPDSALFEVKRNDGQTVFAVYNSGVRVFVEEEESKSRRGGFAIGGFTPGKGETGEYFIVTPDSVRIYLDTATTKRRKGGFAIGGYTPGKGIDQEYLRVTQDSVRIYLDDSETKRSKGGFAIGGYTPGKGMEQEYLRVTEDSTRIYIDNTATKRSKGGFAIGGFTPGKGPATDFMNLSPNNYFIGHESGKSITTGLYNSFMGYEAGTNTKEGANNIFMGFNAGYNNLGSATDTRFGSHNIFLGNESGYKNERGYRNVYIGSRTGYNSVFSYNNTFVGYNAGNGNTSGYSNVFVGDDAGRSNTSGFYNTFIGSQSGFFNTTGVFNTFLGYATGKANITGNYNVFIGKESGTMNTTGSFNVFMGNESGMYNIGGSDNVFLGDHSGYRNTEGDYNTFIGYWSGYQNRTGLNNIFIGFKAGELDQTGNNNIFLGNMSGQNSNGSWQNISLGVESGRYIGSARYSCYLGYRSGYYNAGWYNTSLGYQAGYGVTGSTTGARNVFIGSYAGYRSTTGADNVFMGSRSGYYNNSGADNVFIGPDAGYRNLSGKQNVCIGSGAGYDIKGNYNVCIGVTAGSAETGSNRLYISNSQFTTLIYGEFDNQVLGFTAKVGVGTKSPSERLDVRGHIRNTSDATYDVWLQGGSATSGTARNLALLGLRSADKLYLNYNSEYTGGTIIGGNVGIGTSSPVERLHVVGDAYITSKVFVGAYVYQRVDGVAGGWHYLDDDPGNDDAHWYSSGSAPSDIRLKSDIKTLDGALEKITKLNGVTFKWSDEGLDYFTSFVDDVVAGPSSTVEEDAIVQAELRKKYRPEFEGRSIGLIAQNVKDVVPEVVHENKDGYLQISYGNLAGLTIEAIKEQQGIINELQTRIHVLETENAELAQLKKEVEELRALFYMVSEKK